MKPILFLDCDETLFYARGVVPGCSLIPFTYPDGKVEENRPVILRSSAREFIETLSKKYELRIITQGWIRWQKAVLEHFDLLKYFSDFHGYGDTGVYPNYKSINPGPIQNMPERWVLIDNDPQPYVKFNWLNCAGIGWNGRLINCSAYHGDKEYSSLMELIPGIDRVLS